jgi:hypothetical protein
MLCGMPAMSHVAVQTTSVEQFFVRDDDGGREDIRDDELDRFVGGYAAAEIQTDLSLPGSDLGCHVASNGQDMILWGLAALALRSVEQHHACHLAAKSLLDELPAPSMFSVGADVIEPASRIVFTEPQPLVLDADRDRCRIRFLLEKFRKVWVTEAIDSPASEEDKTTTPACRLGESVGCSDLSDFSDSEDDEATPRGRCRVLPGTHLEQEFGWSVWHATHAMRHQLCVDLEVSAVGSRSADWHVVEKLVARCVATGGVLTPQP